MPTTNLSACEWFVWDLRRSNLLERGQLDQVVGPFLRQHPEAEPAALAGYLVAQGFLTQFQADRLLQGKTQGFVLGPFTLMDTLGTGSMGTVYKAHSRTDNGWYAVKVLPRRSMWNVRLARRKVRAFEQCQHPAVVPFADAGTSGGLHYLAWPLVEGEPLDRFVERQGKLSPTQTAAFALQLAEGLRVCHQQGLFHGLLKPSNLMLGSDGQLRILDLGIGCLLAETEEESLVDTMSTANAITSGLDCASPESILEPTNLTPLGDQYSLGCVLYYCLTGRYPFPEKTALARMLGHQHKEPTPLVELNPSVPAGLADIVKTLMKKVPADRFKDLGEVIDLLRPFTAPAQGGRPSPPAPPEPVRPAPPRPLPVPLPPTVLEAPPPAPPKVVILQPQVAPVSLPVEKPIPKTETPPRAKASARDWSGCLVPLGLVLYTLLIGGLVWLVSNYLRW